MNSLSKRAVSDSPFVHVNFSIGHCCIVTEMYYLHVFLSHSVLALSRGAFLVRCSHIQSELTKLTKINQIEFANKSCCA